MSRVLIIGIVCLLATSVSAEQEENNCHDPEAWTDWHERVTKHPDDKELHVLHALWIGLCIKVESGGLSFDDAMSAFEKARSALIQKRREERQEQKTPPAL